MHHGRYLLGFGDHAETTLGEHGHGYLTHVLPLLFAIATLVIVVSVPLSVRLLARREPPPTHFVRRFAIFAGLLVVAFCVQELAEGMLAHGHPGAAALVTGGGATAIPLALAIALACAGAAQLLERAEARLCPPRVRRMRERAPRSVASAPVAPRAPLAARPAAFGLARRPPPLLA